MKKFFHKRWPILILVLLSGLVVWPLFVPGYFSHHDDLQVMRIFEMRKCFADFQIPCRWVPDMGYGNGYPLFNFYGVFAYYIGAVASYILGFIGAAKFLFFMPLVFGGIGMYFLAKELFGGTAGLVGAVLFLFAPYRALDSYVRGAVAESFAIAIVPFALFLILRLIKTGENKYFLWATIFLAAFFLSHNIMTLIFTPFIIFWSIYFLYANKWHGFKKVFWSILIGLGLSAFFVLPAYFEKNLVQTEALTRAELDFRAQYVKINQLFLDRSWNYSGSQPQSANTISYQIGWPHWWLVILAVAAIFISRKKNWKLAAGLILIFAFSVFMTHNKSAFIWEKIKILVFVQFPWRFLSISVFTAGLLGSYFVSVFKGKVLYFVSAVIIVLTVLLNWSYFRPEHFYYGLTDREKLSGTLWLDQQKGALLDYLPKTALEPRELAPSAPYVVSGKAEVNNFVNKSDKWSFRVNVDKDALIEAPVFDFPNWVTFVNGKIYPHTDKNVLGRIGLSLPVGKYLVEGEFKNTKIRTVSNTISLLSLLTLVLL